MLLKRLSIALSLTFLFIRFELAFCQYPPGDFNYDAKVSVIDVVILVNHLLKDMPLPVPIPECQLNVNTTCSVTLSDVIYLANFVFKFVNAPLTTNCNWSTPVNLGTGVNSAYDERHPCVSLNLLQLYFASDKPDGQGGFDLWVSERADENSAWASALNLSGSVNTPSNEAGPSLSSNSRRLYFSSNRPGGMGGYDIYVSEWDTPALNWGSPVNLGNSINSTGDELSPNVTKDSSRLYFRSTGWGNQEGALYMCNWDGCAWDLPEELPEHINQFGDEDSPSTIENQERLYFARDSSIFIANLKFCGTTFTSIICSEINYATSDAFDPFISNQCQNLYFSSTRSGSLGGADIWESDSLWDSRIEHDCGFYSQCSGINTKASWSPDGRYIAFSGRTATNDTLGLYILDTLTSETSLLFPYGDDVDWSPDGEWLVFTTAWGDLYKAKLNGDSLTLLLLPTDNHILAPSWSPDGSKIAFSYVFAPPGGVWTIHPDGTNPTRISNDGGPSDWTNGGSNIIYLQTTNIILSDTLGNVSDTIINTFGIFQALDLAASPSGDKLAIQAIGYEETVGSQLFLMDSDGTDLKQLTTGGGVQPAWSPTGNLIIYTDTRHGNCGLWKLDSLGCNMTALTKPCSN